VVLQKVIFVFQKLYSIPLPNLKVLAPDLEMFRLGVQKCKKTIQDGVGQENIFKIKGLKNILKAWRQDHNGNEPLKR
jgi:hypothetical protein